MSPLRAALKGGGRGLCVAAGVVGILMVLGGNMTAALFFIGLSLAGLALELLL